MSVLSGHKKKIFGVVAAVGAATALFAGTALAGTEHALQASINDPAAVAPGGTGELIYTVTNVSKRPTTGILLNVSLPPKVSLDADRHCQKTGQNDEGGDLISCNFSDVQGFLLPDQTRVAHTPFHVAADAPAGTKLGTLGALVVPLKAGQPTEDYTDLSGRNTVYTDIYTAGGKGGDKGGEGHKNG